MLQVRSSMQDTSFALWSLVMMYMVIRLSVVSVRSVRRHGLDSLAPIAPDALWHLIDRVPLSLSNTPLDDHSSLVLPYKLLLSIG